MIHKISTVQMSLSDFKDEEIFLLLDQDYKNYLLEKAIHKAVSRQISYSFTTGYKLPQNEAIYCLSFSKEKNTTTRFHLLAL